MISIIIVNYNGKQFLKECLDSLENQAYINRCDYEIIVVDNLSDDGSIEFIQENYPNIKILKNAVNSFTGGCNLGVKNAQGDVVVLLNNDTVVTSSWLSNIIKPFNDETIGAVGSKLLFYDNKDYINSVGTFVSTFGFSGSLGDWRPKEEFTEQIELFAPCGGAVAVRKDLYEQIGGLDESYLWYEDDVDLGFRIWNANKRIVLAPDAILYHKYNHEQKPRKYFYLTRNKLWNYWKNASIIMYYKGIAFSYALLFGFIVTLKFSKAKEVFLGILSGVNPLVLPELSEKKDIAPKHYTGIKDSIAIIRQKFGKHMR